MKQTRGAAFLRSALRLTCEMKSTASKTIGLKAGVKIHIAYIYLHKLCGGGGREAIISFLVPFCSLWLCFSLSK